MSVGGMDICRDFLCRSSYAVFFFIFLLLLLFFFRQIFYIGFHVSTMAKIEIPQ